MIVPPDLINSIRELEQNGIRYLRSGNYSEAEKAFKQEYAMFLDWQERNKQRIHKGSPLHNLALSLFFQGKILEGIVQQLYAYIEDVISTGEIGAADNFPACISLRSFFNVVPNDLRSFENLVLKRKNEGGPFSKPEEIIAVASPIVDTIVSKFKKLGDTHNFEIEAQKYLSSGSFEQAAQVYNEWYQRLLSYQKEIKERVHKGHPLHNTGIALFYKTDYKQAVKHFLLAYVEDVISAYRARASDGLPAFRTLRDGLGIEISLLRKIEASVFEKKKEKKEIFTPEEILSELETPVSGEQTRKSENLQEIIKIKEQKEQELFSRFVKKEAPEDLFVVLRRWNSTTPRYPKIPKLDSESIMGSVGGGYYLRWRGKGIAIDPGYDFLALFFREQFGLNHVDAIIATHAHDDHTQDIETIFSLIHKMNKKSGANQRIELFGSEGVKIKYSRLIDVTQTKATNLKPETNLDLPDYNMLVKAVKTEHNEEPWMTSNTGVGLVIELKSADNNIFRLGITGDTKYWNGIETAFKDLDLLVVHLGTIGDSRSEHLQEEGCERLIKAIRPRLVIVSEFGEELSEQRCQICNRIRTFIKDLNQPESDIPILPGDIGLKIKIPSLDIYCENTKAYKEYKKVVAVELKDEQIHYLDRDQLA